VNVQFSLLGPVRAWRGLAELDMGPNQQRATLALLLVRANQLVSIQDMIELLWEQDPPGSSVNAIHKYIGSIRRLLEPDLEARASGRWLIRHGGGYRLAADENTSDLIAFRRMVKDARSARAQDRPADAFDLLLAGLVLRRGACGEGLDLHGRNRDYFTAVDQEYVAAAAEAADVALATVQAPRILPILRQAALGEPLNESLQARLILVLAATGQQALALSHYQVVRDRLSDELGVDPGAEMCAAHSRVLRQEFSAAALGDLSNAAITAGIAGRSPGTADPPGGQAFPGSSSPCVAPLVPPAQLPPDLPTFAAREPELSQLSGLLTPRGESPGTVVVCAIDGMVGMGTATVAVHLAHHVARHRDDGQLDLDLRGFTSSVSPAAPADALRALPRREECADQTRAAVIAAARRLFAEIGFFQTNIEQIAKLSRVSLATVYAQCGGKQGLLRSLMDSWTQAPMVVETQQKSLAAADAALVMQTLGTTYLQITRQWGDVIRMVIDVAAHDHESGAVLATAQRRHNRRLATICRHLEDIGALRDDVDARLASQIITYYYGIDGLLRTREVFGWSLERSNEWLLAHASAAVLRSPAGSARRHETG
jgi:DNA-binding SARP family transcriptional activator/AcrR family transcriptional regulator